MLNPLLDRYDIVLLDMDGVITSEEVYWNAAALSVYELLHSKNYYGKESLDPAALMEKLPEIRADIFTEDKTIKVLKNKGVNNNWDLAWIVLTGAKHLDTTDFSLVYSWAQELPDVENGMFAFVSEILEKLGFSKEDAMHHSGLWDKIQFAFQEWFLGSEQIEKYWHAPAIQPGKPGLSFSEKPLVNQEKLLRLFSEIAETKRLGIGTGRPRVEAETPLISWKAMPYMTRDSIVTYDELEALAKKNPGTSYAKPHPYMFLRGVFGYDHPTEDLMAGRYDKSRCAKTLVIGDAACDLFAAKNAGCDFAAVLTGVQGEAARGFFEENNADYILRDILELLQS